MNKIYKIFCLFFTIINVNAQITVDFADLVGVKPLTPEVNPVLNTGNITLSFEVDASGNVTLDASSTKPAAAGYVDAFDGSVGNLSDSALWNTSFDVLVQIVGGSDIRINNRLEGLGVRGVNQHIIDGSSEAIRFNLPNSNLQLTIQSIGFNGATTSVGSALTVDDVNYSLLMPNGFIDLSEQATENSFVISSANDGDGQGFVLSSITFDVIDVTVPVTAFEIPDSAEAANWRDPENWTDSTVPAHGGHAAINGGSIYVDQLIYHIPAHLNFIDGSLVLRDSTGESDNAVSQLRVEEFEVGTDVTGVPVLELNPGAKFSAAYGGDPSNEFQFGSVSKVLFKTDGITEPAQSSTIELGETQLTIDEGAILFLDGTGYSGGFETGKKFTLANYGSFSGSKLGVSFGNFTIPAGKELTLVESGTSLYYEVTEQVVSTGPNMIIVYLDDLAAGHYFNFNDAKFANTPEIDKMAENGLVFTNAFASSTVCAPSRYTMLTGRYASRNTSEYFKSKFADGELARFHNSQIELEDDNRNIGAWLQQSGYRTGFVGKCHTLDHETTERVKWEELGLKTYGYDDDPAVLPEVNGKILHNYRVLSQRMRERGFDYVDGFYIANTKELYNDKLNNHHQEFVTEHALEFIDQNHDQPFFLHVSPTIDHGPTNRFLHKSLRANVDYTPEGYRPGVDYSFMDSRSTIINDTLGIIRHNAENGIVGVDDLESARITWVDQTMKAILERLDTYGVKDNTLIVFTADHGGRFHPAPGESGYHNGKSTCYDDGARVPLLYYWPAGIRNPGTKIDELTSNEDFVPTCLSLANATSIIETEKFDGKSLKPLLEGDVFTDEAPFREHLYCEIGFSRSIRTKDWKYIAIRYNPDVYEKIDRNVTWPAYIGDKIFERPYHVINSHLGHFAQVGYKNYFHEDQLYDLTAEGSTESKLADNIYGDKPQRAESLKRKLSIIMSDIPNRPFRGFELPDPDAPPVEKTEFAPAPSGVPADPENLRLGTTDLVDHAEFKWDDKSNTELGFILEYSYAGSQFIVSSETPAESESVVINFDDFDSGDELTFRVKSYNIKGYSQYSELLPYTVP